RRQVRRVLPPPLHEGVSEAVLGLVPRQVVARELPRESGVLAVRSLRGIEDGGGEAHPARPAREPPHTSLRELQLELLDRLDTPADGKALADVLVVRLVVRRLLEG